MGVPDPEMAHGDPDPIPEADTSTNSLLRNTRCCFCLPCFPSHRSSSHFGFSWWERIRSSPSPSPRSPVGGGGDRRHWWDGGVRALKKLREWSEIVAGPKWKTFIRRFNRNHRGSGNSRHGGKFQYDPLSYALNFDDGLGTHGGFDDEDDYGRYRDFSSRFASGHMPPHATAVDVRSEGVAVIA